MINVSTKINSIDKLQRYIYCVNVLNGKETDNDFMDFLKQKFMRTLNDVIDVNLKDGTTNDEYIEEYKKNNIIEDTSDGFVLYNHTMADISEMSPHTQAKYPNGFSIALAFEYGVGIVGENNAKMGAWEYNVNKHNFAWRYKKDGQIYSTYGYEGMEIYRKTVTLINGSMKSWLFEYLERM